MQTCKIVTVHKTAIDRFKSSWPCNGIPDSADLLVVAFDQDGGVLDYEFSDAADNIISDMAWENTGALPALIDDAWANATATNIADTIGPFHDYR